MFGETLEAFSRTQYKELEIIGTQVGKLFTDHGFPIDMSLHRLHIGKEQKLVILTCALHWLIEHRRNSGAPEAALDRQRKINQQVLYRFGAKGEAGLY